MKTTLIQRAKFENRDYKKGIDSILSFDYMGSSEFEWGALPESLKQIRKDINDYDISHIKIKDKIISVFCKENQKNKIEQYLTDLSEKKWTLKEYSDFDKYINDIGKTDFWWDITNNLMFWRKNIEFENKFKKVI